MNKKPAFIMRLYKLMRYFQIHECYWCAQVVCYTIRIIYGCVIPPTVILKDGVRIAHGLGIVLHHEAVIGENSVIYQHVTVGGSGGGVPLIGCNCLIGAGAFLHGPIKIGNNVKIGANAVVLTDVPDNATAVGVPARIINKKNKF